MKKKLVSIVVSAYNEEGNVSELYKRLVENLKKIRKIDYEILFINDGSTDQTLPQLKMIAIKDTKVKIIDLARNFGHEIAMTAGMDHAKGDAVLFMDADLQHPPEVVPKIIDKWLDGYGIVLTKITNNEDKSYFRNLLSSAFYKLINKLSDIHVPAQTPDFRLVSREYVDVLKNMREDRRLFRGMLNWLGVYDYAEIEFVAPKRFSGKTNYNLSKSFSLAINAILQFSIRPLRISMIFSAVCALFSGVFGIWTIYEHFAYDKPDTGYATIICLLVFLFGLQFVILAIMGEYIGRIHIESKDRPLYFARVIDHKIKNESKN
jgi:polyisoprenyl-phosphate glycosyltransferase